VPRLCKLYPGICLTTEESHGKTFQGSRKSASWHEESRLSQYGVYIGNCVGGDRFSVVWCQPISGWKEKEGGCQCSFEVRRSVREEILTGVVARPTRTSTRAK